MKLSFKPAIFALLLVMSSVCSCNGEDDDAISTRIVDDDDDDDEIQGNFLFKVLGRVRRRLNCVLGACICTEFGLRRRIERGDTELSMCGRYTIYVNREIDVTDKDFRLSCSGKRCRLSGFSNERLLVGSNATVDISGIEMANFGNENVTGGAISLTAGSDLEIYNTTFNDCRGLTGGALYLEDSYLYAQSSEFNDNSASYGGAIFATGDTTLKVDWSYLRRCEASFAGGCIFANNGARLDFQEAYFSECVSGLYGGCVYAYNTSRTMRNIIMTGQFFDSRATEYGGAIAALDSKIELFENTFRNNSAGINASDIYIGDDKSTSGDGSWLDCKIELGYANNSFCDGVTGVVESGYEFSNTNCRYQGNINGSLC